MANPDCQSDLGQFALAQAAARFKRLARQIRRGAKSPDARAVHDLRVAIRRLSECFRLFRDLFPKRALRKTRRRLRRIMDLAAEVRNRDIALELCRKAGLMDGTQPGARLAEERRQAARRLAVLLRRCEKDSVCSRWRVRMLI